jgi:hypothetical protein
VENLKQGIIDLHGLHIIEAEICLRELIPIYQSLYHSLPSKLQLKIITGSGHHSIAYGHGNARLLPAIQALCENEFCFLRIQELKDNSGYVSGLLINL